MDIRLLSRALSGLLGRVARCETDTPAPAKRIVLDGAIPIRESQVSAKPEVVSRPSRTVRTTRKVYMWGKRDAFPGGSSADVRRPTLVENLDCVQVAFGPDFGCARTASGELIIWGSHTSNDDLKFWAPMKIPGESGFEDVQCSQSSVWGLKEGSVYIFQDIKVLGKKAGDVKVREIKLPDPIEQFSVGTGHAAFLTTTGRVFMMGKNNCGQCAQDPRKFVSVMPTEVDFPTRAPLTQVMCGHDHTIVMEADGYSFSFGDDSKIQLALGDTRSGGPDVRHTEGSRGYRRFVLGDNTDVSNPVPRSQALAKPTKSSVGYGSFEAHEQWRPQWVSKIPIEFERQAHGTDYPPPLAVHAGADTTLFLVRDSPDGWPDETHLLFCCGNNALGQCGRSLQTSNQTLASVRLPRRVQIKSVDCGREHCLAVVHRKGASEVWGWGSNSNGQVGSRKSSRVACPAEKVLLPPDLAPYASKVFCNFSNSAVILEVPEKDPEEILGGSQ